jgi:hypothetical protein
MAFSVGLVPGTIIRWRKRRFVVVDSDGMETIISQEYRKGGFERIPVREALPDKVQRPAQRSDLISVPEEEWRAAVRQFEILKPLLKLILRNEHWRACRKQPIRWASIDPQSTDGSRNIKAPAVFQSCCARDAPIAERAIFPKLSRQLLIPPSARSTSPQNAAAVNRGSPFAVLHS